MRYLIGNEVGRWYIDPEARLLGLDAIDHLRFQARRLSSFFASELKNKRRSRLCKAETRRCGSEHLGVVVPRMCECSSFVNCEGLVEVGEKEP